MSTVKQSKQEPAVWQLTADEVAARYKTNTAKGLSHKEARRRLNRLPQQPLFVTSEKRLGQTVRHMLADPVLWLLLAMGILALFFERVAVGIVCTGLALLTVLLATWGEHYAERFDGTLHEADIPLGRVLRNDLILRIPANEVVPGDIVLLEPGDIVPADARLITGKGLRVSDPLYGQDGRAGGTQERDVYSAPIPTATRKNTVFYDNMVNGGGTVVAGRGRAIVTSVGMATHLGAMKGPIPPTRHGTRPIGWKIIKDNQTALYLCMIVSILPLVGLMLLGSAQHYGLLDISLTAVALAAVCISRYTLVWIRAVSARMRSVLAHQRDAAGSAEIKSTGVMESMNQLTDLVLLGSAALHDGVLHPEYLCCAGQIYTVGRSVSDEAIAHRAALLYLTSLQGQDGLSCSCEEEYAQSATQRALVDVSKIVLQWAEPDITSLKLQIDSVTTYAKGVRVTYKNQAVQDVYVTQDENIIYRAETFRALTEVHPASEDDRCRMYGHYREAILAGHHVWFLVSEQGGQACLEGFVAVSYHGCRKTKGAIRDLEKAGIRVTACISAHTPETDRFLKESGIQNVVTTSDTSTALKLVQAWQHEGRHVGVFSVDHGDLAVLHKADVAFTCRSQSNAALVNVEPDGTENSATASDLMRRRADVLVRRCSEYGGGVCGIRNTLLCANAYAHHVRRSLCYLLTAQILRFLMVCIGFLSVPSAMAVLVSGWVVDPLVLTFYGRTHRFHLSKKNLASGSAALPQASFKAHVSCIVMATTAALIGWGILWLIQSAEQGLLHTAIGQFLIGSIFLIAQLVVAVLCYRLPKKRIHA